MSAACPVFGFVVSVALQPETTEADRELIADDLVALLEKHGLMTGGGGRDRTLEFVVNREGAQATHGDRELVTAWAVGWRRLAVIAVGELVDLNEST